MKNTRTWGHRTLAAVMGCMLATTLCAPAAFAATAEVYQPTTYRVTVYAGNQGTVSLGAGTPAASVQLDPLVELNGTADFSDLAYQVEDGKYYAKGIRIAGLDNVRSDRNTDTVDESGNPVNSEGADTMLYAVPTADGALANTSAPITEDTDFVVAYGILANRVAYTVNYVDAETGTALADPQTFFGDIGDRPAAAPQYIENYLPQAALVLLTLSQDETKNVITFRYARLAEGTTTVQQPSGRVDVEAPDGSTAVNVYTTAPTPEETAAAADTATATPAAAPGDPANPIEAEPLVTDEGTQILAADGTPLSTPDTESINDEDNALASGQQPGDQAPVVSTAWVPWAAAAAAIAAIIVFILVRSRKKQANEEPTE